MSVWEFYCREVVVVACRRWWVTGLVLFSSFVIVVAIDAEGAAIYCGRLVEIIGECAKLWSFSLN